MFGRFVFCILRLLAVFFFEEMWKQWIEDESTISDKNDTADFLKICELYEKAVKDYLCK